mmetsp:Transcript_3584/g.10182  ORF Transcript_3584/g.10182 Transcript_3584/m.10182 type:complete len:496 (+) Transcript_3584:201-1688(+)|eukprot:CAMPEP_0181039770 /NCGR_PEP_ID=MMETSP1070-20121207/10670_1 /TAXON_ID=265543 /ORGANISM="Minutocellus polymorphus, Strain NH13" /LENGTH=495 /DNA_ID=CAMNT_0023117691 /DNA_START=136 /DNA_END=1623 /DNA_ORIENTATION=-
MTANSSIDDVTSQHLPMQTLEVVMHLKMEVAELRTSLDDSRHLARQYKEQATQLHSKLTAATEERGTLNEMLSKYKTKMIQMKTTIGTLKRERTEMRVTLEAAQSEAVECRNRSRQLLHSNENLMDERDTLTGMVISEEERRASSGRRVRRASLLSQVSLGSISLPFTQPGTSPHDSHSTVDSNVLADVAKAFARTEVQVPVATDDTPKDDHRRPSRRSSWRRPSLIDSLEEEAAISEVISAVGTSRRRSLMQRRSSEMSLGLDSVAEDEDLADQADRLGIEDDDLPATLPVSIIGRHSSMPASSGFAENPLACRLDIVGGQDSITLNDIILPQGSDDPFQKSDSTDKDVIDFLSNQLSHAELHCSDGFGEDAVTVPSSVAQNLTTSDPSNSYHIQGPLSSQEQDLQGTLGPSNNALLVPPEAEDDPSIATAEPMMRAPAGVLERVIGGLFQERVDNQHHPGDDEATEGKNSQQSGNISLSTRIPRRNSLNSKTA